MLSLSSSKKQASQTSSTSKAEVVERVDVVELASAVKKLNFGESKQHSEDRKTDYVIEEPGELEVEAP